jgi:asparagine synthase (glutamine-hydrolysing)
MKDVLPEVIINRKNKMGFPVPLNEWTRNELKDFINDLFAVQRLKHRPYFNTDAILNGLDNETKFGRKIWGLLSLEIWYQEFIDNHYTFKQMLKG